MREPDTRRLETIIIDDDGIAKRIISQEHRVAWNRACFLA